MRALARQRRARAESGRFLVEGPKLLGEALAVGIPLTGVYVDGGSEPTPVVERLIETAIAQGVDVFTLDAGVLDKVSATTSPQSVIAVAEGATTGLDVLTAPLDLVIVGIDINDPGNLGTLIRSGVAMGVDAVVVAGTSVDVHNPKTVRSTAGALFHTAIAVDPDPMAALAALSDLGLVRIGTRGDATMSCEEVDLTRPLALVVGSEAHGLPANVSSALDEFVSIPMTGPVESLNVAMAATIVCYEAQRQRRTNRQSK